MHKFAKVRKHPLGEAIEIVVLAVVVSYIIRIFVFQAFYIPTRSMAETLMPYDHILSEKFAYFFRSPARGEIVVFNFGDDILAPDFTLHSSEILGAEDPASEHRDYVKRVIGVAGDEISFSSGTLAVNGKVDEGLDAGDFAIRIKAKDLSFVGGKVLVDGLPLNKKLPPSIPPSAIADRSRANFIRLSENQWGIVSVVVPPDHLYLLGDNRPESADSRYFGFLPVEKVSGRALLTYWPLSRFNLL